MFSDSICISPPHSELWAAPSWGCMDPGRPGQALFHFHCPVFHRILPRSVHPPEPPDLRVLIPGHRRCTFPQVHRQLEGWCSRGRWGAELIQVSLPAGWDGRPLVVQLLSSVQFSRSVVSDSATPWTAARQASLSITNSRSLPKLMSIESVMPSYHFIFCRPLLPPPSIFPSIRVFSNESSSSHQVAKVLEFQLQHQSFQ